MVIYLDFLSPCFSFRWLYNNNAATHKICNYSDIEEVIQHHVGSKDEELSLNSFRFPVKICRKENKGASTHNIRHDYTNQKVYSNLIHFVYNEHN